MKTPLTVLLACAVMLMSGASHAFARDRPGTPNQERAYVCGDALSQAPAVCVDVNNTASEPVWIETEVTLEGRRVDLGAFGGVLQCNLLDESKLTPQQLLMADPKSVLEQMRAAVQERAQAVGSGAKPHRSCQAATWLLTPAALRYRGNLESAAVWVKTGAFDRQLGKDAPPLGIRIRNVAPGSGYCFRFRARRLLDEVVSAEWSNRACVRARALPPRPDMPRLTSAVFMPAAWSGNGDDKPLPNRAVLRWAATANAAQYEVLGQRFARGRTAYEETIEVPAAVTAFGGQTVTLCALNIAGRRCTSTLFARSNESHDGLRGRIKGGAEAIQGALAAGNDFNGDRYGDLLWHNEATHETQIWFLRGHHRVGRATVTDGADAALIGPPWGIVGSADFSGEGHADLLWYNSATGESQLWFMDSARLASRATVVDGTVPFIVGPPWQIVRAHDMNGDRRADIVWHNSQTGALQVWVMDRHRVADRVALHAEGGGMLFVPTAPLAIGDLDADGSPDLVVRNGSELQVLFMNGTTVARRGVVRVPEGGAMQLGPTWSVVGANDFNRDGHGDLLLHDSATGQAVQWLMRGESALQALPLDARLDGGGALVSLPWRPMKQ